MGKLKVIKWDNKKASEKMLELIDEFTKFQSSMSPNRRLNEDIYTSNFYNNSVSNLGFKYTTSGMKEEFSDWLTEAKFNHTFTFIRLLHSMMISNEPIATASPVTNSDESREAASASDRLIRWGKDKYKTKNYIDNWILHTLIYGLGCIRIDFNSTLGDLIEVEVEEGNVTYNGDIETRNVLPDNYMLRSTTTDLNDVFGYIERIFVDKEEAEAMFPEFAGKFTVNENLNQTNVLTGEVMPLKNKVVFYEYYEKATPFNARLGRYILCTEQGEILKLTDNPQKNKRLPIALLPDIIVPNRLYPLSIIDYLKDPQKQLNDLMSRVLENVKLYSKIFMLIDRGAKVNEDALVDSPLVPIEYQSSDGGRPPTPMNPASLPAFVFKSYDMIVDMMQHLSGIRDFSRGVMAKNVSGFATNLMIESDNKVHIQLHERYKAGVKTVYELMLDLFYQHIDDGTLISIVGQEDEIDVMSFKQEMLEGGYQIQVDYGTSLPVDPVGRRQAIRELIEFSRGLGVNIDPVKTMDLLKLGDLMGAYDIPKAARKRQREEIKEMSSSEQYVPVNYSTDDHVLHYTEIFMFFQSKEYYVLPESAKIQLKKHADMHLKASPMLKQGVPEEQFNMLQLGQVSEQQIMQQFAPAPQPMVQPTGQMQQAQPKQPI